MLPTFCALPIVAKRIQIESARRIGAMCGKARDSEKHSERNLTIMTGWRRDSPVCQISMSRELESRKAEQFTPELLWHKGDGLWPLAGAAPPKRRTSGWDKVQLGGVCGEANG
jgi:hypothetical protein